MEFSQPFYSLHAFNAHLSLLLRYFQSTGIHLNVNNWNNFTLLPKNGEKKLSLVVLPDKKWKFSFTSILLATMILRNGDDDGLGALYTCCMREMLSSLHRCSFAMSTHTASPRRLLCGWWIAWNIIARTVKKLIHNPIMLLLVVHESMRTSYYLYVCWWLSRSISTYEIRMLSQVLESWWIINIQ